jgi:hypothetical protein
MWPRYNFKDGSERHNGSIFGVEVQNQDSTQKDTGGTRSSAAALHGATSRKIILFTINAVRNRYPIYRITDFKFQGGGSSSSSSSTSDLESFDCEDVSEYMLSPSTLDLDDGASTYLRNLRNIANNHYV